MLGYAVSRGITLLSTLVLARLLAPEDIGVVLTAMVIVAALNLLSDTGLGVSLVVREHLDDRFAGTVLVCMVASATLLAVLSAVAAPLFAALLGARQLQSIIPFLSITVVFSTIGWFFQSMLQRGLLFARRFAGLAALSVGYAVVGISAAAAGAGPWSLVAGQLAGTGLSALVFFVATPHRVRPCFDLPKAREAYRESRAFLAQALTSFLTMNLHFVAVAGVLGSRSMGVYSMAFRLSALPSQALAVPVAQATFPAFARMRSEQGARTSALLTSLRYVVLAGLPPLVGLAVLARPFADGVLGPKWSDVPPLLILLSVGGAVALVAAVVAWFVNALGGASWLARINLRLLYSAPAVFAAALIFHSALAVGVVIVVDALVELGLLLRYVHRNMGVRALDLWRGLRGLFAASAGLAVAAFATDLALRTVGVDAVPRLAAGAAAGAVAYLALILLLERRILVDGRGLARRALGRGV